MKWQKINQTLLSLLRSSVKTPHSRIVTCGLLVGLCYLPVWLATFYSITLQGSSNLLLNTAFIYLGLQTFWKQRQQLAKVKVFEEERFVGHSLIVGGSILFFLCQSSISLRALTFALILIGIAWSSWGLEVFRKYALASTLLLLSVYADLGYAAISLWRVLTPPNLLENFMAWTGSVGLQAIGQPAVATGPYLSLPAGAVQVASGCNGFDMAFTIATASFVVGLVWQQSRRKIVYLMVLGALLALVFNIPRIMLVTIASVYWGKASFEFWHGPWGGQIFSTILFTAYYYLIMGMLDKQPVRSPRDNV